MKTAVSARNVVKSYGERRVLDDVSFQAGAGQITAVLGRNGAGKTTLMEICAGLRQADAGEITVLGMDRQQRQNAAKLRQRVGVMVQEGGLPMAPSVKEVITHIATLRSVTHLAAEMIEKVDLGQLRDTPVRRLSGGEKQRVAVACALLGSPDVIFLDEPTAGVDPHSRHAMWDLLRAERERGAAIIITTHLMEEAETLADAVQVIESGRTVAAGTVAELTSGTIVSISEAAGPIGEEVLAQFRPANMRRADGCIDLTFQDATVETIAYLSAQLQAAGYGHRAISVRPRSLETVFFALTRSAKETVK